MNASLIYIRNRTLSAIAAVIGSIVILLLLPSLIPGDPATVLLGPRATPEAVARLAREMGLDRPIYERFVIFVGGLLHGNMGTDVVSGHPVLDVVAQALPNTIVLALTAIGIALLIGIPLAAIGVAWRNRPIDQIAGIVSIGFVSAPTFVVSVLLLLVFSVQLGWFPVLGSGRPGDFLDQLWHLVLPATALALAWTGYTARLLRSSLLEIIGEDHIRTMRAYGVPTSRLILKYALKPASVPTLACLGMGVGELLGGAVFVEFVFNRPGLGSLISESIAVRNYPVVQGGVLTVVVLYIAANFLVDLSYGWIDPRLRARHVRARRGATA